MLKTIIAKTQVVRHFKNVLRREAGNIMKKVLNEFGKRCPDQPQKRKRVQIIKMTREGNLAIAVDGDNTESYILKLHLPILSQQHKQTILSSISHQWHVIMASNFNLLQRF